MSVLRHARARARLVTGFAVVGAFLVLSAFNGFGCSVIVSNDVPDVACVDAPGACPDGQHCDATTQHCVSNLDGAVVTPEASDSETGGNETGVKDTGVDSDAPSGPQDLGTQCRFDTDCKSKLCASSTLLTTAITSTTGPICASVCCTSADCPSSFVCFNGGTGGAYCVPASLAQRSPSATSSGAAAGASCVNNTDCRSGLCTGSPKTCFDNCCTVGDCAAGTTCRLPIPLSSTAHNTFSCVPPDPGGTGTAGTGCGDGTECLSGVCTGNICRPPCSNTASCHAISGFTSGHCIYANTVAASTDYVRICLATTTTSDDPAGAACTMDSTCQSGYCDPVASTCANVCGHDADCDAGEVCLPSAVSVPKLRCVPKPT